MKKLKIFLLLSILLCFGFVLSPEVQARSVGPKILEEGDVLPATTQLKISWGDISESSEHYRIQTGTPSSPYRTLFQHDYEMNANDEYESSVKYSSGGSWHYLSWLDICYGSYLIFDTSSWSELQRTVVLYSDSISNDVPYDFFWEDLNAPPGPKLFEEDDILPAGYIKISWDFTDKPIPDKAVTFVVSSGDDVFNDLIIQIDFNYGGYNHLKIFNGGSVEHFNVDTPGFTIITLTESVTITDLEGTDGITSLDYNVYIGNALTWEVVSEDYLNGFMEAREIYGFRYMDGPWMSGEAAWNHGYDKGSEETWDEGFEYGMEIYGYYDPITEQWLSVEEYLELYGTDKMNQSDFYNNFDKYFIPAMIIVFGGAIVLTILKVFKGRE